MFTGLIEEIGRVKRINRSSKGLELMIKADKILSDVKLGDSISVDGVCLTVKSLDKSYFKADVMAETLNSTNINDLRVGDFVNLERAMRLKDRLGGHLVSGHVDSIGRIEAIKRDGIAHIYEISAKKPVILSLISKGSVAIDGISLTIKDIWSEKFSVSIIPHTLKSTTLGKRRRGDRVNIETDMLGKHILKQNLGLK
ncbi:MAG: riboflavin synthase [Actinomycetota bacterium]|nr:riboflavin synthase [Actinomycetota bacterium]